MLRKVVFITLTIAFIATSALGAEPVQGTSKPGAKKYVEITASSAILQNEKVTYDGSLGHFRVIFKATSVNGNAPFFNGYSNDGVDGWQIFTSAGAVCQPDRRAIKGIDLVYTDGNAANYIWAMQHNAEPLPLTTLSDSRPSIIIADFDCDGSVTSEDSITIQLHMNTYFETKWIPLDFTFENISVK